MKGVLDGEGLAGRGCKEGVAMKELQAKACWLPQIVHAYEYWIQLPLRGYQT